MTFFSSAPYKTYTYLVQSLLNQNTDVIRRMWNSNQRTKLDGMICPRLIGFLNDSPHQLFSVHVLLLAAALITSVHFCSTFSSWFPFSTGVWVFFLPLWKPTGAIPFVFAKLSPGVSLFFNKPALRMRQCRKFFFVFSQFHIILVFQSFVIQTGL